MCTRPPSSDSPIPRRRTKATLPRVKLRKRRRKTRPRTSSSGRPEAAYFFGARQASVTALAMTCRCAASIQKRRDDLSRLLARNDGHDLECHSQALTVQDPLLKQPQIVAFHQLKAAVEVGLDPAPDISQPFGEFDPGIAHPLVDRDRVPVLETLDHHEEHG